ncbi:MAG: LysR family transcriptional regulator [Pigmentiphaga sp.]
MEGQLDNAVRGRLRLRHLDLLVGLNNTGSLHKVAARLSMTQSAASKLLRDIEDIYETQLFTRSSAGLQPTPAGEAAIRWASSILRSVGDSLTEVKLVRDDAQGRVRVGVFPAAISVLLGAALSRLHARWPDIVVSVVEGSNEVLLPALARHELDVVLGRLTASTQDPIFDSQLLYDESVCVIVRGDHPWMQRQSVGMDDLAASSWIMPTEFSPMRPQFEQLFVREGVPVPRPRVETASLLLSQALIRHSDMLAVMPERVARHYCQHGPFAILPCTLPLSVPPAACPSCSAFP